MINKITIFDAATQEVIEREATSAELAFIKSVDEENKKNQEAFEASQKAKQSALAKLAALGLTEAEIAAL
jgi:hypothetical protein